MPPGESEAARLLRETIAEVDEVLTHAAEPDFLERVAKLRPRMTEATTAAARETEAQFFETLDHDGFHGDDDREDDERLIGRHYQSDLRPSCDFRRLLLGEIGPSDYVRRLRERIARRH